MGKSSRLAIALAGARVICFALLTLLRESRVGAVTFAYSGFEENSLNIVSNSAWLFDKDYGCFGFSAGDNALAYTASGRILYPGAVQMKDSGSTSVKSFSISFIYLLLVAAGADYYGSGLAFGIVPDNTTLGGSQDFMGLITEENTETAKNYESDNHTLGVELDTYLNSEFSDPNNNHIGINLASMTSVYTFKPVHGLTSSSVSFQQIWIDYSEVDTRMDIYYANYKEGKPATPQGSKSGLDLSLLKENMYIGFTTSSKYGSISIPYVCAWSFSNDGNPAPSIVLAQDATPSAPPPPAPVTPSPPPPAPVTLSPPPNDPVAAPSLPPPESLPASNPPPSRARNSPPSRAPSPAPSPSVRPQVPNSEPPTITEKKSMGAYAVVPVSLAGSVGMIICIIVSLCWCRFRSHPLRIFISHAGGPTGSHKNFPTWLNQKMNTWPWSVAKSRIKIFIDKDIEKGKSFPDRILQELARFDMGVVVVTEAFFVAKWPMTELIAFVKAQSNDRTGKIRVLPLFYELRPDDVRKHLRDKTWESKWNEFESTGEHPLQVENCRDAVKWLCEQTGIRYDYERRDHDEDYIETICREVDQILCKERSFATYLMGAVGTHCIPRRSKPGTPIRENERALL